jgi:hypothetical protein
MLWNTGRVKHTKVLQDTIGRWAKPDEVILKINLYHSVSVHAAFIKAVYATFVNKTI